MTFCVLCLPSLTHPGHSFVDRCSEVQATSWEFSVIDINKHSYNFQFKMFENVLEWNAQTVTLWTLEAVSKHSKTLLLLCQIGTYSMAVCCYVRLGHVRWQYVVVSEWDVPWQYIVMHVPWQYIVVLDWDMYHGNMCQGDAQACLRSCRELQVHSNISTEPRWCSARVQGMINK